MAATKYSCRVDSIANALIDIKAALVAKSLITATLYETSPYLIFSTPLSTKVIKIYIVNQDLYVYYGDAYTSGSTITNQTTFCFIDGATSIASINVIADTTFFVIVFCANGTGAGIAYVGALDNGDDIMLGGSSKSNADCSCFNVTDSTTLNMISFGGGVGFFDASNNIYSMPLMLCQSTGELEMNGTDPAEVVGLKVASVAGVGITTIAGGAGYVLTPSNLGCSGKSLSSSILIEYTP